MLDSCHSEFVALLVDLAEDVEFAENEAVEGRVVREFYLLLPVPLGDVGSLQHLVVFVEFDWEDHAHLVRIVGGPVDLRADFTFLAHLDAD